MRDNGYSKLVQLIYLCSLNRLNNTKEMMLVEEIWKGYMIVLVRAGYVGRIEM